MSSVNNSYQNYQINLPREVEGLKYSMWTWMCTKFLFLNIYKNFDDKLYFIKINNYMICYNI